MTATLASARHCEKSATHPASGMDAGCGIFLGLMALAGSVIQTPQRRLPRRHASTAPLLMPARSKNQRRRSGGRRNRYGPPKPSTKEGDDKAVEVEGEISAVLAGTMFRVRLQSGHEVLAHISGKMRKRFIRLVVGDRVKMEMSPYDLTKARIVFRLG